ncbi:TspO/MBR family protein [Mariniplasma anaerobium]|uniref:Tryptophan-rich sensory protein n=1 Tax=Mariniplasma anaerobium TaxID=2735436 RepID=A0A7U9THU1_9MOLU|nr:tryptophan-rich sensory protein [Mariniplasma anaerobium]BCR36808.1 hypothetical protein MPAN_017010 [Mariniplasma anaerobium]
MLSIVILKVLVGALFVGMLIVNYLANKLPLNHRTTGAISSDYPSLFTPAGITFSIWGVIYLFLGLYVFQTLFTNQLEIANTFQESLMYVFLISSLLNILWLFMWHYDYIFLSTIAMVLLLATLIYGYLLIPNSYNIIKTPFSLYTAWISVALIANITILLVKHEFKGFGIKPEVILIAILFVATIIGGTTILYIKDLVFGFVFLWAFFGILIKHIVEHQKKYTSVIYSLYGFMFVIAAILVFQLIQNSFQLYGI